VNGYEFGLISRKLQFCISPFDCIACMYSIFSSPGCFLGWLVCVESLAFIARALSFQSGFFLILVLQFLLVSVVSIPLFLFFF
jgi:hypothetical protein